jgi:integrase/recombinase XerD
VEKQPKVTEGSNAGCQPLGHEFRTIQNLAVLELLFATGIRVGELCSLNLHDVDLSKNSVQVLGKGSRERSLLITHHAVFNILERHLTLRHRLETFSNALFLNRLRRRIQPHSIRILLRKATLDAKLALRITPHMFRHTTATLMLENGIDIRIVQRLLGHSSISTTQWYTHVSVAAEQRILEERHPRNLF